MLTHIDAYAPDGDSDEDEQSEEHSGESSGENSAGKPSAGGASGFDRDVDMPGIISLWLDGGGVGWDEMGHMPLFFFFL